MIELLELKEKVTSIFKSDVEHLGEAIMESVNQHDVEKYDAFVAAVEGDLATDWLQMVFQYYHADRDEKKQDYTPKCLAEFMGLLAGDNDEIVDLCAGSGALTIQKWIQSPDAYYRMYEIDEKVIPYLLFNCVIRNIHGRVCLANALQDEVYAQWEIAKGERYGRVTCVKSSV